MKLGAIALMFVLPMAITDGTPPERASLRDYREVLQMLRGIDRTLDNLEDAVHGKDEPTDCRKLSPEKTVRCAADTFGVSEEQAVAVWRCESNFGIEPDHSDAYHGPFQYLYSTYASQQASMPDVVKWYELSPAVHDVRSNILTAVAWSARHGWGPWSCA
jgi:hypothetical protein